MPLDQPTRDVLAVTRTIELTTVGRRSGRRSRIEIWWFHIEGRFIVTGTPGRRDWYANVLVNPGVIVHSHLGDHPGRARPISDAAVRSEVFSDPTTHWYMTQASLEDLVVNSPMIEIDLI